MISVVVVDDHTVFREGLRALLARVPEVEVVGEASNTDDAVAVTASTRPDVVLMDLNLPGGGGEVATRLILAEHTAAAVLVLTMHVDDTHLQRALRAGAHGYRSRMPSRKRSCEQSKPSTRGKSSSTRASPVRCWRQPPHPSGRPFPSLTEREFEVLDRIARGLRNDAIADRMGISRKTVQNNVSSILLKLGATDRAQAVVMARDAGLGATGLG